MTAAQGNTRSCASGVEGRGWSVMITPMRQGKVLAVFTLLLLGLAACDQNVAPPGTRPRPSSPAGAQPQPTSTPSTSVAGITWRAPASWQAETQQRPMRAATYQVPDSSGGEAGECAVFYFGPGEGGDVQSNLKRWTGQFQEPGGKSAQEPARIDHQTMNGLRVTTVDVSGTYVAGGPMAARKELKPAYRLLGAIVEAPQGNVFFKFTGPAQLVTANENQFAALLQTIQSNN